MSDFPYVSDYELVAAGQSTQVLGGGAGKQGDILQYVVIIPTTTAAGAVSIKDGGDTAIAIFDGGGTTALTTLTPIVVHLGARSKTGAWQITTGTNVRALCVGRFQT
jgi:hypothetical protein